MSLLSFHRLLIAAAIAFCLGFAGWEIRLWFNDGNAAALLIGLTFALLGIGLFVYLLRMKRILGYTGDGG